MPVDLVRDAAVDVILRVFTRGVFLDASLDKTIRRKKLSDRGRRFLTHLSYGTVRHRMLCDHVLARLCRDPLEQLPPPILAILRMAVYQGIFLNQVTQPAMVHTSVELAKRRGHAGLARLVNAVLRRAPASLDDVVLPDPGEDPVAYLSLRYSTPVWLLERWREEFGETEAAALCAACCEQAPASLRVNTLKTSVEELSENLGKAGLLLEKRTGIPEELTLLEGMPPFRSKWFQGGHFIAQDPASLLPPHLLEPQSGERVLDLCAAPGGKTTHIAQLTEDKAFLVAMDAQNRKLGLVRENAERLGMESIRLLAGDGTAPPLRPGSFDRVLVDAPCSGLGTLRRHPDLKWRMNQEAITRLAAQQRDLLLSAVELCKTGGVIVYSVCTFTREETRDLVRDLAAQTPLELENGPELLNSWNIAPGQYQTLPTGGVLDGFFLTRFRKRS